MRSRRYSALVAIFFVFKVFAQDEMGVEIEALKKTQDLLKDSQTRGAAINGSNAVTADKAAKNLGDKSGQTDNIYSLSNDVFESMLKETNGDTDKVQKLLQEGMRNPADFASKMTPEQQKKLKDISEKIEGPKSLP
jgi:uncharacterized membrane-anchored protein